MKCWHLDYDGGDFGPGLRGEEVSRERRPVRRQATSCGAVPLRAILRRYGEWLRVPVCSKSIYTYTPHYIFPPPKKKIIKKQGAAPAPGPGPWPARGQGPPVRDPEPGSAGRDPGPGPWAGGGPEPEPGPAGAAGAAEQGQGAAADFIAYTRCHSAFFLVLMSRLFCRLEYSPVAPVLAWGRGARWPCSPTRSVGILIMMVEIWAGRVGRG